MLSQDWVEMGVAVGVIPTRYDLPDATPFAPPLNLSHVCRIYLTKSRQFYRIAKTQARKKLQGILLAPENTMARPARALIYVLATKIPHALKRTITNGADQQSPRVDLTCSRRFDRKPQRRHWDLGKPRTDSRLEVRLQRQRRELAAYAEPVEVVVGRTEHC